MSLCNVTAKKTIIVTTLPTTLCRPTVFHSDHLGSTSIITDYDGEVYEYLLYLPFGELMAQQKVAGYSTPYKFIDKELDEETGLMYYGARYYNAELSIWHGVDPLASKYPSYTSFAYTVNNPIRFIDPDGKKVINPYEKYKGYGALRESLNKRLEVSSTKAEMKLIKKEIKSNKK